MKPQPPRLYGLTQSQQAVLACIGRYIRHEGQAPTFDEIRATLRFASKSQVHRHVHALRERGHLDLLPRRRRSIVLLPPGRGRAA
jgi:SOS-response transcriptional repressor LexA